MRPLLSSLKNVELVRAESQECDQLFTKLHEAHDHERYANALNDDHEIQLAHKWLDGHDKEVFMFKQSIIGFLNQAKELLADDEIGSIKSGLSHHSKHSIACSSSSKSKLMEAKAAALEVKAAFLKERQALRMASEELELRQEIAQAKIEERVYEQFEMEHNINCMNDGNQEG